MSKLMKFYGKDCPHCIRMEPFEERLEDELGVKLEKLEVWYNEENALKQEELDTTCGGVPFYLNKETGKTLCGSVDYEVLKKWAQGKPTQQSNHSHEGDAHDQKHQNY